MIHTDHCHACQLSIIPRSSLVSVGMLLLDSGFFAGCTGNTFFAPTRDLPSSWRGEYPAVERTLIEDYTPDLDVFLWQFARNWMGQAAQKHAYIAAPVDHVCGTLDDEMFLVKGPETLTRIMPEDCNIHWRGFEGELIGEPGTSPSGFTRLLGFLRKTGVVLLEDEADESLLALCQRWAIPLGRKSGKLSCSKQSATSFVWFLPQGRKPGASALLATTFACWYGIESND
jgi:hypothetical protein